MQFPVNPVSSQEESLNVNLKGVPTTSRFEFEGKFHGKCTNVSATPKGEGAVEYAFEFVVQEGPGKGLTFTRKVNFPDFADMLLATASALGVKPDGENLALEKCKGVVAELDFKKREFKGKTYTNINRVNQAKPEFVAAQQASGPTIL